MQPKEPPAGRRHRARASFWTQAGALARKSASFQKRRWLANLALLSGPFLICGLLWVLQNVINAQLDSRAFRCGCRCTACCDWVSGVNGSTGSSANGSTSNSGSDLSYQCYEATEERPCSPYAECQAYDDTQCGFLYSTADQVGFCAVAEPPLWPALLDVPQAQYRPPKAPDVLPSQLPAPGATAPPPADPAPMLYTGEDPERARRLMAAMWARGESISDAVVSAYLAAQAAGQAAPLPAAAASEAPAGGIASEAEFVQATSALARGLTQFGLVMGTSADTSISLLMEPAFVSAASASGANSSAAARRPPLYFAQANCSALSAADRQALDQIGQAITNLTGFPVECASLPPAWQVEARLINDQVYCGWGSSACVLRAGQKVYLPPDASAARAGGNGSIQEYVSALYDWHNTAPGRLNLTLWANDTNVGGGQGGSTQGPPEVQRWSQPLNLAANAYLREQLGAGASAALTGVKGMPKGPSRLSLDFSSLLGPLFAMWLLQLMLPVAVHTLVSEKEQHLRQMMKMQGLRDSAYYAVSYAWHFLLYCAFVAVFCLFGGLIGLKLFTLNSYSLQAVFYLAWGLQLTSWGTYFSALWGEARPAVLLAVIWIIISGFMANLVHVQYIERGPAWAATALQWIPSFNLYRGLYELSQYAFLADRTGGTGLTWGKLTEPGCGMLQALLIAGIEAIALLAGGTYIEQVRGVGTGIRRHRLFFLGFKLPPDGQQAGRRRLWRWRRGAAKQQQDGAGAKGAAAAAAAAEVDAAADPADVSSPGWLDSYYGAYAAPMPTPNLPPRLGALPAAAGTSVGASGASSAGGGSPAAAPAVPRKPTSVRLSVTAEPASSQAEEAAEGEDVAAERGRVESLWRLWQRRPDQASPAAIMLRGLRKVFPARDGNAEKVAVADLSLAISRRECFGLLGPNGAGKTTTIRMMEGFMHASAGQAVIEGLDIARDMDAVYSLMGACPQHDLLWDGLTGREHLLLYARLKNLAGRALRRAVDDALRSVNLLSVGDDLVGGYSGGMKRRLSVAISLCGDPAVVYLDEPSTGLDPASRQLLWNVIREARRDRAVVLTTHSMEEAEALCDRLGIFVNGRLQCVGDPKDLISRFGGYLSFTITTPPSQEAAAAAVVRGLSPSARLVYSLGGTQKYELPVGEASVDVIFARMEEVKASRQLDLLDWGVSNATLEEVFIRITRDAQAGGGGGGD